MFIQLKSTLHTEDIGESLEDGAKRLQVRGITPNDQVIYVMTGGTEGLFVEKVEAGEIDLTQPVYLVASGQSNSLAASLEILAYINQQGGKGQVLC